MSSKLLIKNSLFSFTNTLITIVTGWIVSVVVARHLGPERYGIFCLVLWLSGTILWIIGLGFITALTKFTAQYKNDGSSLQRALFRYTLFIEIVLTLVITTVCLVFHRVIADYFFSDSESVYFFLAICGLIPGMLTSVFSATIEGMEKFEYFTYASLILTPFSIAAKIFVVLQGYGITGLLVVMFIFSFLNTLFYVYVLVRQKVVSTEKTPKLSAEIKKKFHRYGISVGAIQLIDKVVWDKSENFFLGRFSTAEQIGYFNLGFNLAQRFMSIIPHTFWKVLFPSMAGFSHQNKHKKIKQVFFLSSRYIAFFSFPIGAMGILLSYHLIKYLYGVEYIPAKISLQIIFFASMISSLSKPGSAILYGSNRQGFILRYGIVLGVINIGLNIVLIPAYGALGAAISYGFISLAGSIGGLIYTCNKAKLPYPFISIAKIAFSTIIMSLCVEMVLLRSGSLLAVVFSLFFGFSVYVISSITLARFQREDFVVFNSIIQAFPAPLNRRMKKVLDKIARYKSIT